MIASDKPTTGACRLERRSGHRAQRRIKAQSPAFGRTSLVNNSANRAEPTAGSRCTAGRFREGWCEADRADVVAKEIRETIVTDGGRGVREQTAFGRRTTFQGERVLPTERRHVAVLSWFTR